MMSGGGRGRLAVRGPPTALPLLNGVLSGPLRGEVVTSTVTACC